MRARARAITTLLFAVAIGGCKKEGQVSSQHLADDIDAIESALNESDRELKSEGVVVAYRSTPMAQAEPPSGDVSPSTPEAPPETPVEMGGDEPDESIEPAPPVATDDGPRLASPEPAEDAPMTSSRRDMDDERERPRRNRRAKAAKSSVPTQCERICGLAESTCDLRDRICRMAERHFGDVRYATSCIRAEDQCEAVRSRCESCAA
jgi:hypothetical protein